ncbi:hypothetical protein ABIA24_003407 [Sinorhizobium fredii]|uniref:hypothetical protein n=1 Tax=Rhizobium fredii TaxID=380 RepID=UPI00351361F2
MEDDGQIMTVEYQDGDVSVSSTDPLRGTIDLVGDNDEIIQLLLDRHSAEWLMSALGEFLDQGEGGDALKTKTVQ